MPAEIISKLHFGSALLSNPLNGDERKARQNAWRAGAVHLEQTSPVVLIPA